MKNTSGVVRSLVIVPAVLLSAAAVYVGAYIISRNSYIFIGSGGATMISYTGSKWEMAKYYFYIPAQSVDGRLFGAYPKTYVYREEPNQDVPMPAGSFAPAPISP